jgi:hypothetical protein
MVLTLLSLFSITYLIPTPESLEFYESNSETIARIASEAQKRNSKLSEVDSLYLGYVITENALERQLDPLKVAAIISVESDFRLRAYNPSGDYSLAQINHRVWSSEFDRLGRRPLKLKRLTQDVSYAIDRMTEILQILKRRHKTEDFYGYYHSGTPKLKLRYEQKLATRLN